MSWGVILSIADERAAHPVMPAKLERFRIDATKVRIDVRRLGPGWLVRIRSVPDGQQVSASGIVVDDVVRRVLSYAKDARFAGIAS